RMPTAIAEARRLSGLQRKWDSSPKIRFAPDSLLEGSGFELSGSAMRSHRQQRGPVAPPDSAMRGGSLNGRLTTPIGGGPATARLTRREDRSAQLGRGPKTLVIGRQRTIGS